MSEHVCQCTTCTPALRIFDGIRQGPDHWGVRFGTADNQRVSFTLDGEPLANVVECRVGNDGWAFVYVQDDDGEKHACATCLGKHRRKYGVCAKIVRGNVAIARIEPYPLELEPAHV